MKKTVIIFMGLGLLLAGCSALAPSPTATPAPTETAVPVLATSAEDIIGIWQFGSGDLTVFFQFDEDGTYRTAQRVVTNLQDSPQQFGQFTLEASLLTLVNNDNSPLCPGQSGTFEVYLLKQGQISIVQSEDPCTIRAGMGGSLERLSP